MGTSLPPPPPPPPDPSVDKSLEELIAHPLQWIYAHIDPEDRPHLSHAISLLKGDAGPDRKFAVITIVTFRFGTNSLSCYYERLLDAVLDPGERDFPEILLEDLRTILDVKVINADDEYHPQKPATEPVNPVDRPWPEKGPNIWHPVSGLAAAQVLETWRDSRGSFVLNQGRGALFGTPYYYYVRVSS